MTDNEMMRKTFIQQLNLLFHLRDDFLWRNGDKEEEKYYEEFRKEFIQKWGPL